MELIMKINRINEKMERGNIDLPYWIENIVKFSIQYPNTETANDFRHWINDFNIENGSFIKIINEQSFYMEDWIDFFDWNKWEKFMKNKIT